MAVLSAQSCAVHSPEINLVNNVAIAIRGSLSNYERELVKEIFIQIPTFEVARGLDEELSKRIGDKFSSKEEQQRLMAILLAQKEFGRSRPRISDR